MIRNTHVVMLTSALRMIPLSIGRLWVQKMSIIFGGTRSVPQGPQKNEQFSEGALPAVTDSFKAVVNRPDSTPDTVKVLSDSTCENSGALNGFKFVVRSLPKTKQTIKKNRR